ncbi:hypothetical protein [Micromonospora sp. NPDC049679]
MSTTCGPGGESTRPAADDPSGRRLTHRNAPRRRRVTHEAGSAS